MLPCSSMVLRTWALLNAVIAYLLINAGKVSYNILTKVLFFAGFAALCIQLSLHFG